MKQDTLHDMYRILESEWIKDRTLRLQIMKWMIKAIGKLCKMLAQAMITWIKTQK